MSSPIPNREQIVREAAEKIICLNHERDDTYDSRVREATDIITAAIDRDDKGLAEWLCRDLGDNEKGVVVTQIFDGTDGDRFYEIGHRDDYGESIMVAALAAAIAAYRGRPKEDKAERDALKELLWDVTIKAEKVMAMLAKHGGSIVPHLIDDDDNAGEYLREAIGRATEHLTALDAKKGAK